MRYQQGTPSKGKHNERSTGDKLSDIMREALEQYIKEGALNE